MCKRHIINAIGFSKINMTNRVIFFNGYWDLPDGPVVKTLHFHWQRKLRSHMSHGESTCHLELRSNMPHRVSKFFKKMNPREDLKTIILIWRKLREVDWLAQSYIRTVAGKLQSQSLNPVLFISKVNELF